MLVSSTSPSISIITPTLTLTLILTGDAQINFFMYQSVGSPELFWDDGVPLHRARFPNSDDDQLLIPNNSITISSVRGGGRSDDGGDAEVSENGNRFFCFGISFVFLSVFESRVILSYKSHALLSSSLPSFLSPRHAHPRPPFMQGALTCSKSPLLYAQMSTY